MRLGLFRVVYIVAVSTVEGELGVAGFLIIFSVPISRHWWLYAKDTTANCHCEGTEAELAGLPSYIPFLLSNPARVSAFASAMIMGPQLDAPRLILIKTLLKEDLRPG